MKKERETCCRPETEPTAKQLDRCLHQCGHYLYHHTAGPRQRTVLQLLRENGPMSQQDIQETLSIQSGSVSELISKLENKGFLTRQRDETDRRKVVISLTEQGQALEMMPQEEILSQRYTALDETQQVQLLELLNRLLDDWGMGGNDR